ncbi:131_t:CDS:2 [Dentiscutata erythropus]|uniref:131_t:CDS:1 n=1 Tax=Dentiscutata erythropus TaxID=1348616 RepID=A0A9N9AEK2_9GLOM|nr:131_t:CDS:2 [Dentiscutata erythropus]
MHIPFSFEDLDLDEYDYGNGYEGLVEEANEDNESDLENSSTTRPTNIEIQKTQPRNFEILETQPQSVEIQPERSRTSSNPYLTSSIMAPFKPLYHSDSPMIVKYGKKRKPLVTIKNSIVINLPLDVPPQGYDLKIHLKIS